MNTKDDKEIHFSYFNFSHHFYDVDGDNLTKIKILHLPDHGTLNLSGIPVKKNDEILA